MKSERAIVYMLFAAAVILGLVSPCSAASSHGDRKKLPKGCASCHSGHGMLNTPMLPEGKDVFCFRCHGDAASAEASREKGILGPEGGKSNIRREFEKPYRHPVEQTGIHRHDEILPEVDPSARRHAECGDCHHHHLVAAENRMTGIRGTDGRGASVQEVNFEYELCFKCHSKSANLPGDQTDKADAFDISNPSYHPVLAPGRNYDVPSLSFSYTASSMITCSDCHGSDDSQGPRGPHGSLYEHILVRNYNKMDGPEGPFQYALCYGCHRRDSILGNESFPYHRLHVSSASASCRNCHNSHGSRVYSHLIDFDTFAARPSGSGRLEFIDFGARAGQCFLSCHGKDHDPATYPGEPGGSAALGSREK